MQIISANGKHRCWSSYRSELLLGGSRHTSRANAKRGKVAMGMALALSTMGLVLVLLQPGSILMEGRRTSVDPA